MFFISNSLPVGIQPRSLSTNEEYYRHKEIIGEGSQAKVFKAILSKSNQVVAIKAMKLDDVCTKAEIRFMQEFGQSHHYRGIPRLFDLIRTRKYVHIVMQYFEGVRLSNWRLSSRTEMPATRLKTYENRLMLVLFKVVTVLYMVHSAGLIHLDLKPSNILVDRHENVMVIDFGGIRIRTSNPSALEELPGKYMYTRKYRAPELREHRKAGYVSDIYSVGCIGIRLTKKMNGNIAKLFPRVNRLIEVTLKKEPESRPSAKDLLRDDVFRPEYDRFKSPDDECLSISWIERVVSLTGRNEQFFKS